MRGGRVAIAAVAVALTALVLAGSALACSCVRSTPAESLARSDAAVVGRLLTVAPRGTYSAVFRYRVLHVYRGRDAIASGSILEVSSSRSGAACGLPERAGGHFGLFLYREGGRWAGSLCGLTSPRRLRAAARQAQQGSAVGSSASPAGSPSCAS